jgi:cell division transport system permease protein
LHLLSIFSLAVAFVCLGASLIVVTNLKALEVRWARAGRASVYLKDNVSPEDVDALKAAVAQVPGVAGVRHVSAKQARDEFLQHDGGESKVDGKKELAALPLEVFQPSVEIDVKPEMPEDDLKEMVAKLRAIPTVDDVETYQAWTERLSRFVRGGFLAAALLAAVVFASVLAVVGSTVRMALHRRSDEVEVMKLVGATDEFVKTPFVLEGSLQGGVGALGAVGILAVLFAVVRSRLDAEFANLIGIEPVFLPWEGIAGLFLLGVVLGALAALASLRKLVAV